MVQIHKKLTASSLAGMLLLTGCTGSASSQQLGDLKGNGSSIDESSIEEELLDEIELGEIDSYYSIVCGSVAFQLQNAGFTTGSGAAKAIDSFDYSAVGVYYYNNDLKFWDDESCQSVGFMEVVNDTAPFRNVSDEDCIISVVDTNEPDSEIQRICTYNYEEIGSGHLVYENMYITYYQQSPMRVVYSVQENAPDNYDLELGSLFDYDTKEYIYDESIFEEEYVTHSAIPLTEEIDYVALEKELQKISEKQEKNGYTVESFEIAYISPENLRAYIDSQDEDTFFGTPVSELTKAFGEGNALVFEDGELKRTKILNYSGDGDYEWSDFLMKCGAAAGTLLVSSAVESKFHPGATAINLIVQLAEPISEGLIASLHELVLDTVMNMDNGLSLEEAITLATPHALKTFADKFFIASARASIVGKISVEKLDNNMNKEEKSIVERIFTKKDANCIVKSELKNIITTLISETDLYQTTVETANSALKNLNPELDILALQNDIQNAKKNFTDKIITTAQDSAEYITVSASNATDEVITILMMPWTKQSA